MGRNRFNFYDHQTPDIDLILPVVKNMTNYSKFLESSSLLRILGYVKVVVLFLEGMRLTSSISGVGERTGGRV